MKTFLTADWHLGHENIIKFCNRPFASAAEMDEEILSRTNSMVGREDRLIIIGDFTFAPMGVIQNYLSKIKSMHIVFVFGNHDSRHRMSNFLKVHDIFETKNPTIVCCHYAMAVWNKLHHGAYHAYGHSHGGAEEYLDKVFPDRRSMDVGVDNINKLLGYYGPISQDKFLEILSPRKGFWFDGHKSNKVDD